MGSSYAEWKVGDPMINERDYFQDPDYVAEDPEKEKIILELATLITDRVKKKLSHSMNNRDPEYWALDHILTKEEAKFALSFKKTRVPYTIEEVAKRNGMTVEEAQKMADRLVWIGLIEYVGVDKPGETKKYVLPIFVPGSAEYMMMQTRLTDEHPEMATFFNLMTQLPLGGLTEMIPPGGSGVGMHVIPVERAIEMENKSVSVEHISHWLDQFDHFGVGECSCRKQQAMRGEGDGELRGEFCIACGDLALYQHERKIGRDITKEEVLEIIERAERHGYVHQITNIDGEDKIVAICNCAPGVCNALRTSQLYNTPNMSASAYRAKVEKEKCVACGKCVEVCPVGAAKLGQKLCRKDGTEVKYPKSLLPDAVKWGPDKWNYNYRDDMMINCYDSGTAPCKTACPVHLSVQGYIKMASEGRFEDALKLIKLDNPFPAVCGAICNRRCEDACTRGTIDQPLAIDEIKKYIAQLDLDKDNRYVPFCEKHDGGFHTEKVAVIGAGPAGLSAAFFLRKDGYPVTVFEKESRPGGMMMNGIPSYRLDKEVVDAEIDVMRQMGVEIKTGVEVGKDVTIQQLRDQGYKAFFVAIGMQGGRLAGVPGEDAEGVQTGVDFLRKINQDHSIKISGDTVVVGGGNVAIDVARTAVRAGASKVTMLCLEGADEMPAAADEVAEAKEEGIIVNNGWGPKEIRTEGGKVTSIVFKKCTQVKDADGRFNPQYDENETIEIPCENVLLSIGQSVQWGGLLDGTKVELNRNQTAKADPVTLQTAEPDIFVGGDVYTGARFVIDAIAGGREGMVSINRFVHPGNDLKIHRDLRNFIELDKENIQIGDFDHSPRQIPGKKAGVATETFDDLRLTLTAEQVATEAKRCLSCGATTVDENRCIGCGLCTTRCEFDAIHLHRLPNGDAYSKMRTAQGKMGGIAPYAIKRQIKIMTTKQPPKGTKYIQPED